LDLHTGTQTWTIDSNDRLCSAGPPGSRCFCSGCSGSPTTGCSSNAECAAIAGGACTAGTTSPNSCSDGLCTANTPPDDDSINEGICADGPYDQYCAAEPTRGCTQNAD